MTNHLLALIAIAALPACVEEDHRLTSTVTDEAGEAEFEVTLRYAGMPEWEAQALLDRVGVVPAAERFPGVDLSQYPVASDQEEVLDAGEPTFVIDLLPLNERAASERFAWTLDNVPPVLTPPSDDGFGETHQGLSVSASIPIVKYLEPFESWRTQRFKCYAPFGFAASVVGYARGCVDMGYEGKAGTRCSVGYDPTSPIVVVHDGIGDNFWNARLDDKKWFTGRVTAIAPTNIVAWGTVCL